MNSATTILWAAAHCCYIPRPDFRGASGRLSELSSQQLQAALAGDAAAVRTLIRILTPVIQVRVGRTLLRRGGAARGRDVRQEVEDLTQEVFVALFARRSKALRTWDPARGMSLRNFVGMIAEQQVVAILRTGRRNPFKEDPTLTEAMDRPDPVAGELEQRVASRQFLQRLLDRLRCELSPLGMQLFTLLMVQQRSPREVCQQLQMSPDAVYAWRSRLKRLVPRLAATLEQETATEEVRS